MKCKTFNLNIHILDKVDYRFAIIILQEDIGDDAMDNIIDITKISSDIESEIKKSIKGCIIRPSIALIQIGDNKISKMYSNAIEDACDRVGIYFRHFEYEDDIPELTVINKIKELNNDEYVNGIVISLPLPERYNEKRILNTIVNSKDINGVTDINIGRLISGRKTITTCISSGIMNIFKYYGVDLDGKEVTVVCDKKSNIRSLISILINLGATVTICTENTKDIKKYTLESDIVISSINKNGIINCDMIKEGTIVIDAGISIDKDKIYGDVDYDTVVKKAKLITPKVDGINSIMISMLLSNTLLCYNSKK